MTDQSPENASFDEKMLELYRRLKQLAVEGSEEDFIQATTQMLEQYFVQVFPKAFKETFLQIFPEAFEHHFFNIIEKMPEAILKAWMEQPELRFRIRNILAENLAPIVADLPEGLKSDPEFFLALRAIGFLPFWGTVTGPVEYHLRAQAWKQDRLGPTLEHAVKAILQTDEESYGFFVKDLEAKYVYVNRAMEQLLERPKSEIEGRTDAEIYDKKNAQMLSNNFNEALDGNLIRHTQTRRVGRKNKTFLQVLVAKRDPWDRPVGVYGICREITDPASFVQLADIPDSHYPSRAMGKALAECLLEAETDSAVLLTGETGSGKEYLARYIHNHSKRAGRAFWSINMAAFPDTLFESELFGYEEGAHYGARERKPGQLELAQGGTLLLDEIGDVPLNLQVKLLTCLEHKEFLRLGGRRKVKIDSRIIYATNKDLYHEVEQKNFRKDLLYRINASTIRVPPLRERLEDIPLLVKELISVIAQELSIPAPISVTEEALERLSRYNWPGNVRELKAVLQRAVVIARGKPIDPSMLTFGQESVSQEESDEGKTVTGSQSTGSDEQTDIELAIDIFHGLSEKEQGYHLDIMVNQLCEGQSGVVKCVSNLLEMSDKTVKSRLKLVTDKKARTGTPGRWAKDRILLKLKKYLIDEFLKQAR